MKRARLVTAADAALHVVDCGRGPQSTALFARVGRKRWWGLTVTSRDADALLGTELGGALVSNVATKALLPQHRSVPPLMAYAVPHVEGEQRFPVFAVADGVVFRAPAEPPVEFAGRGDVNRVRSTIGFGAAFRVVRFGGGVQSIRELPVADSAEQLQGGADA